MNEENRKTPAYISRAVRLLEDKGMKIIETQAGNRYGTLDIIAMTPKRILVFADIESPDKTKGTPQAGLRRATIEWLLAPGNLIEHNAVRFDTIVETNDGTHHIEAAF